MEREEVGEEGGLKEAREREGGGGRVRRSLKNLIIHIRDTHDVTHLRDRNEIKMERVAIKSEESIVSE